MNSNVSFCFLGDGPLLEECEQYAQENLLTNVSFMGFVDNGSKYMANSKILLIPSLNEGNPMVINEAIASGMMVIGSDVGGIHDLLINLNNCFLCEPNNELSFYLAMKECLNIINTDRACLSGNKTNYSIESSVISYFDLFGLKMEVL